MSAAKMVADSTQSDLTCDQRGDQAGASREPGEDKSDKNHTSKMKRRKNVDGKKNKKTKKSWKKGTKKKNESTLADENNPDLDLDKVLKEIGDFIKNRQEMVDEMFHAVRGASLDRALPEALKSVAMEDLKRRCVEHLEVMSRKRIFRIMAGDDPSTISSSGTEEESSDEDVTMCDHAPSAALFHTIPPAKGQKKHRVRQQILPPKQEDVSPIWTIWLFKMKLTVEMRTVVGLMLWFLKRPVDPGVGGHQVRAPRKESGGLHGPRVTPM
ncbi:uncharacterized protein LOC121374006 isoform X3 [Gigantopelta aegis]|uniref:uncharacterized protein LOC121374006 isoform X3 n=1 Tax=Gigantopelta aegis TaxID=1735272 RepID=UPI001B88D659|nr:uncharacterized protein LOC121374006 isoform X3 [Gigantopelta aegis]